MNESPLSSVSTALVLGGGGSTGNAWLIGVVAGLFEAGVDVTRADLTIGTSAGSTAAAQLSGATPPELFAATVAPVPPQPNRPVVDHLERMRKLIASSSDAVDFRRKISAAALAMDAQSDGSHSPRWRAMVGARLPTQAWPERRVLITAVDARTGEPVVFERHSGVELVDAVAASCSSGLPYRLGERRLIDGGFRANAENADLAAGCSRVLVLSPFSGQSLAPLEWGTHLGAQVDALRSAGSSVETVFPDPESQGLFGANAMDGSLRPDAARAGYEVGRRRAEQLRSFWR